MKMRFSLMEAVHYSGLLTESQRRDFVVKSYGPQMIAAFAAENHAEDTKAGINAIEQIAHDPEDQEAANRALASQIVDYVATFDPSLKKIYTLWICQRIMKRELAFADLAGVQYYLQMFEQNKNRIALKDIGQYKTIEQLAQTVAQFEEKSAPVEALTNNNDMQVVYESSNVQVVMPKSVKGATQLGKDTIWCTAWPGTRNRFKYYQNGDLYVTIDKAKNARWQFYIPHERENRSSAEFMDRANKPIDLGAFFDAYPMVFKVIGEAKLSPWIANIGISKFSDATLARIPPENAYRVIRSTADLARFPTSITHDPATARQILGSAKASSDDNVKALVDYYMAAKVFTDAEWLELATNFLFVIFKFLPARFHTDANKNEMADNFRGAVIHSNIKSYIPEPWTKHVTQLYWDSRTNNDRELTIPEIPAEYLSDTTIANVLRRNPSEMTTYDKLTEESAIQIIAATKWMNAQYLPDRLKTKRVFDYLVSSIRNQQVSTYDLPERYAVLAEFPLEYWSGEIAPKLMGARLDLDYKDFPEAIRTDENILWWVKAHPTKVLTLPKERISLRILSETVFEYNSSFKDIVSKLTPELVSPQMFVEGLEQAKTFYYFQDIYNALPDYLKASETVMRAMMERKAVPVADMGRLITSEAILARVKHNRNEVSDIPKASMSADLAARIVTDDYMAIEKIGDDYLTENVLYAWLNSMATGGTRFAEFNIARQMDQFERFDKKLWTVRTLALALELRIVEPTLDNIPKHLLDDKTIAAVVRHDPDAFGDDRASALGEENITDAITKNISVLDKVDPEKMTEGMAYAALRSHAKACERTPWLGGDDGYSEYHYNKDYKLVSETTKASLGRIPKRLWSKRCWYAAVSWVEPLNKVPARYVDDKMVAAALLRDPRQIAFVENPADWLTKNGKTLLSDKLDNKDYVAHFNQLGVFKMGREWIDATELERKPIEGAPGYSFVFVWAKTNYRAYLFDKKGKIALELWSSGEKMHTNRVKDVAKHADAVKKLMIAEREYFAKQDSDILKDAGVFSVGYGSNVSLKAAEELKLVPRGNLFWTDGSLTKGTVHTAYAKESHKNPLVTIEEAQGGNAFGNGGSMRIDKITNHVPMMKLRAMASDFAESFNTMKLKGGYGQQISTMGLYEDTKGAWHSLVGEKLGESGEFTVYRGLEGASNRVSVFHNILGYLGGAKVLKNGTIKDLDMHYNHRDLASTVSKLLEVIAKNRAS